MKVITKNDCLDSLKKAYEFYAKNFSIGEYRIWRNYNPDIPNEMTIISKFKGWNRAKSAAGIQLTKLIQTNNIDHKSCNKCGETKELTEFHLLKTGLGGRNPKCKACYNEYKREHHHENKARMNLKSKIYYNNNKEKISEQSRERYKNKIAK